MTGPATLPIENERPRRALAGCRLAGVTVEGSRPLNAGAKNASAAPYTAASPTSAGTVAPPPSSRVAATSWQTSRTRSEAIRIFLRSSRSAQTPAGRASTTNGRNCAADTIATSATPPPIASTANGIATAVTRSPRIESTWLPKSRRYCGSSLSTAGSRRRCTCVSTGQECQRRSRRSRMSRPIQQGAAPPTAPRGRTDPPRSSPSRRRPATRRRRRGTPPSRSCPPAAARSGGRRRSGG